VTITQQSKLSENLECNHVNEKLHKYVHKNMQLFIYLFNSKIVHVVHKNTEEKS